MRLLDSEVSQINRIIRASDPLAKIYLFGSRVHDHLKGGDIDLLIISKQMGLSEKFDVQADLKLSLGDQKIDILIRHPDKLHEDAFVQRILSEAILLE